MHGVILIIFSLGLLGLQGDQKPATLPVVGSDVEDRWWAEISREWELTAEEKQQRGKYRAMLEEEGLDPEKWMPKRDFAGRFWSIARERPLTREEAFAILLRTGTVGDVAVSVDGEPSVQVRALGILLDLPEAAQVFADLAERAGPAGKFHALVGLQEHDKAAFRRVSASLSESEAEIEVFSGCTKWTEQVSELFAEPGRWKLMGGTPAAMAEAAREAVARVRASTRRTKK